MDGNHATWNSTRVAEHYRDRRFLFPPELAILGELWHEVAGRRVLDLGVGTGRTTPFLRVLTDEYVGIDWSETMVAIGRQSYPTADIRQGDARDLVGIPEASVAFVLFSFNGIDYIPYEDRRRVFREVRRVLEPGGAFAFSTHNLNRLGGELRGRYTCPPIGLGANPFRSAIRLTRWLGVCGRGYLDHRRLRAGEHVGEGYAVVNDGGENYSVLTTYVDPRTQLAEVERCGFVEPIRLYGRDGRAASVDSSDAWLHYLARKPATSG